MKEWRQRQYQRYIGVINTHFQLTDYHKRELDYIIDRIDNLKRIHRQATCEQILTSLAIKLMKDDGRKNLF